MEVGYSHHLVTLVARVQTAAVRLAGVDPDRRAGLVEESRRRAAFLSARLDGSPLLPETALAADAGDVPVLVDLPPLGGGWARALKLDGMDTQEVAAVEYANLRTLQGIESELAGAVMAHPLDTMGRIHGVVCQGLVEPDVIGQPRVTEQAVHDGGQGMIIFRAMDPAEVGGALSELSDWISRRSIVVPPIIAAGVVHERLLEIQPFEAGNGRVARAMTRLVLVAHGIDPHGAAVLEEPLWADAQGYHREVAATMRRRGDLTRWLERHTGALAVALETAVDALDPEPLPRPPDRGVPAVAALAVGDEISLLGYATDVGVDMRTAHADLTAFARARLLAEVPGGAGLTFARLAVTR